MCEICLKYRCPAACPSYETERGRVSVGRWDFRKGEWKFGEKEEVRKTIIVRKIERNQKEGENGKRIGF